MTYNINIWKHYPIRWRVSPVKWVGSESTSTSVYCYNYHGLQPGLGSATKRRSSLWSTAAKDKRLNLNIIGIWFHWRKVYLIIKIIMHIKVFVVCISINCCKRTDRRVSISWGCGSVVVQFIFKIIMYIAWFCCVQHQEVTNIFS